MQSSSLARMGLQASVEFAWMFDIEVDFRTMNFMGDNSGQLSNSPSLREPDPPY